MRFWEDIFEAKEDLWRIQKKLKGVEKDMPKEKGLGNIGGWSEPMQQLMDAIGRHPAAEADADVADAINAIDDALYQRSE